MNRKLSFLAVLVVIVAMLAVTSLVLAAPEVTRDGDAEVPVGESTALVVTEGDSIQWYKSAKSDGSDAVAVGNEATLTITPDEGYAYYYAVVDGETSNIMKVTGYVPQYPPLVFRTDSVNDGKYLTDNWSRSTIVDHTEKSGVKVVHVVPTQADCSIYFRNVSIDVSKYKYITYKYRTNVGGRAFTVFHMFTRFDGTSQKTASADYYNALGATIGDEKWHTMNAAISVADANIQYYNGGRIDWDNSGPVLTDGSQWIEFEYIAAFTDTAQRDAWLVNEADPLPDYDGKFFQFKNDEAYSASFLPDAYFADDNYGVELDRNVAYDVAIKSRDKFDLADYSIAKVIYKKSGGSAATLSFIDAATGTTLGTVDLTATGTDAEAIADLTDVETWKGEFGQLQIKASANITVSSIAFLTNSQDAKNYKGNAPLPVSGADPTFDSAIWWNFADSDIFYAIETKNADKEFNLETASGLNTVTLTALQDGNITFTFYKDDMSSTQRLTEASTNPYMIIGYNSAALEGTDAYLKFWVMDAEAANISETVNFKLTSIGTDDKGFSKAFVDLSSLSALKELNPDATTEFRGEIQAVEIGFAAKEGQAIELPYIVFFYDDITAQQFDGQVIVPPSSLIPGSWKSKSVVRAEYVTLDDLDMTQDVVSFNIGEYSRISRIALQDLKKDYSSKKITAKGDGYYYEFYPKNVKAELETWYYDLDVNFDGTNSGDVYRPTIKKLAEDLEGEYVGGAYFQQNFMKDRSLPFNGRLYVTVSDEFNDKYIDVYRYDPKANALELAEHAPVTDGKLMLTTLGGDLAFIDSNYQPTEEELAYAKAIDVYENTMWDAKIFDVGGPITVTADEGTAKVTEIEDQGVACWNFAYNTVSQARIDAMFTPNVSYEVSEYPVMVMKLKMAPGFGSINGYMSTDYYTSTAYTDNQRGYTYFPNATYYAMGNALTVGTEWQTKIIDLSSAEASAASGMPASGEGSVASYPFTGMSNYFRIDFNVTSGTPTLKVAYLAFFKNAEDAKAYTEARDAVENRELAAALAEKRANMPKYIVFDFLDTKETAKWTLNQNDGTTITSTKMTKEGFYGEDDDNEFNYTRVLNKDEQFSLLDYPIFVIKAKASHADANSQLYLWQDNQGGNPRYEFPFTKANEFEKIIIDLSTVNMASGTADGTLTRLRFDPIRAAGNIPRNATIEYMGFFMTMEDAEAFTSVADAKNAK